MPHEDDKRYPQSIVTPPGTYPKAGVLSHAQQEALARKYFGDLGEEAVQQVIAIMQAESGGRVDSIGDNAKSGHQPAGSAAQFDYGLMQINSQHGYDPDRLVSDPAYNMQAAREIYDRTNKATGDGFTAWSTYNAGLTETAPTNSIEEATKEYLADAIANNSAVEDANGNLVVTDILTGKSRTFIQNDKGNWVLSADSAEAMSEGERKRLAEDIRQFDRSDARAAAGQALTRRGQDIDAARDAANLAEGGRQFDLSYGLDAERLGLTKEQFAQAKEEFAQNFAENARQFDVTQEGVNRRFDTGEQGTASRFAREQAGIDRRFDVSEQGTNSRFGTEQAGINSRFSAQLAQQAAEQGRAAALAESKFRSEVLRNPSDFVASAFAQRGEGSPRPVTTQADILNELYRNTQTQAQPYLPPPTRDEQIAAEAADAQFAAESRLNAGGVTRETRFIVADNKAGTPNRTQEMIINPTGAPIRVIDNKTTNRLLGSRARIPRFAVGTDNPYAETNPYAAPVTYQREPPLTEAQTTFQRSPGLREGGSNQTTTRSSVPSFLAPHYAAGNPLRFSQAAYEPYSQETLVQQARLLSPPAVRAALAGNRQNTFRPATNALTLQGIEQLTPAEREALNTRLGVEFNTTLEEQLAGLRSRFGGTITRPRARFVA